MSKINILNKSGFLTNQDRKEIFEHAGNYFNFKTCLDLSEPVIVTPYITDGIYSLEQYSNDLAAFIAYWHHFVLPDLNGFSGFGGIKFVKQGFNIAQ